MWLRIIIFILATTAIADERAAPQQDSSLRAESSLSARPRPLLPSQSNSEESFAPITREHWSRLQQQKQEQDATVHQLESSVKRLMVFARLIEGDLLQGRLELEFEAPSNHPLPTKAPRSIGRTNLQQLKLSADNQPVQIACDDAGNVVPLPSQDASLLQGTWSKQGIGRGTSTIFQIELPTAAVCDFELTTEADVEVSSPNALAVTKKTKRGETVWTFRPYKSSLVTLSCVKRVLAKENVGPYVSVFTNVEVNAHDTQFTWHVTTSTDLVGKTVILELSERCAIGEVDFSPAPKSHWIVRKNDQGKPSIHVTLPRDSSNAGFRIHATAPANPTNRRMLPFVTAVHRSDDKQLPKRPLKVWASTLKVSVQPPLLLTNVVSDGINEDGVAYSQDGAQTLTFQQHAPAAHATLFLTSVQPLIHDSVVIVMEPEISRGNATAYVSLEARSGELGQAAWTIAAPWRVTEVKEANTGFPLLFRLNPSKTNPDETILSTYLRAPVTTLSQQVLQINLQSTTTGPGHRTEAPALVSSTYHRQVNLVATEETVAGFGIQPWMTTDEVAKIVPWLSTDILSDRRTFEVSPHALRSDAAIDSKEELFATIDYAATRESDSIIESIQLRLRCRGEIPSRIPISITPGTNVKIATASSNSSGPVLTRSGVPSANWVLQRPLNSASVNELHVQLIARRKVQQRMAATVIVVKNAKQSGGSIRPPSVDDGFTISLQPSDSPIRNVVSYPAVPPHNMTLNLTRGARSHQLISGTAFRIVRAVDTTSREIETAIRLHVESTDDVPFLRLHLHNVDAVSTFVNGRSTFAESIDGFTVIPLNSDTPSNTVDLLFRRRTHQSLTDPLKITRIVTDNADSQHVVEFVLLPPRTQATAVTSQEKVDLRDPNLVYGLMTSTFNNERSNSLPNHLSAFISRWNTAAIESQNVLKVPSTFRHNEYQIQLRDIRFDTAYTVVCAIVAAFFWRLIDRSIGLKSSLLACLLIIGAMMATFFPSTRTLWLNGILAGTCGEALYRTICQFRDTLSDRFQKRTTRKVVVATFVMGLLLVDGGPVLARQHLLPQNTSHAETLAEALVIKSSIDVRFESPKSCKARLRCQVATQTDGTSNFVLPLTGVTLTGCTVDHQRALPVKTASGGVQIEITNRAQQETVNDEPQADTDETLPKGWQLRTIDYTIRTIPQEVNGVFRIRLPYAPSPQAQVRLTDDKQQIQSAWISGQDGQRKDKPTSGPWKFATVFGGRVVELNLKPSREDSTAQQSRETEAHCVAEVSPQSVDLSTTYIVNSNHTGTEHVRINAEPRYRIHAVESTSGRPLLWSMDNNAIVVQVPKGSEQQQQLIVRQSAEFPVNLSHTLHLNRICTINGEFCTSADLIVSTNNRFVVDAVLSNTQEHIGSTTFPLTPRDNGIIVRLKKREAIREAHLMQTAIIHEDEVDWSCVCRLNLSGVPLYRQEIRLPKELKVTDVTAFNGNASRLQVWTRTSNSIVVALREASWGPIEFTVRGTLARQHDTDTKLPVVDVLGVEVLKSEIELSAPLQVEAYISELGSAVPATAVEITKDRLTQLPMRFTLHDNSIPIVIKARPERRLKVDAAVIIYDIGGQPLLAQCLSVRMVGSDFDMRFRLKDDGYPEVNPAAMRDAETIDIVRNGDEFFVLRPEAKRQKMATTLIIPDLIPPDGQRLLPVSLPEFNALTEVTSHAVFDLRETVNGSLASAVPVWLADAMRESDIGGIETAQVVANYQYNDAEERFRIELFRKTGAESSKRNRVITATGIHTVYTADQHHGIGRTDLLVFCSDANFKIPVTLPPELDTTEVRLNGRSVAVSGPKMEITSPSRVSHVAMTWTTSPVQRADTIMLPQISATSTDTSAIVVRPDPMPLSWSVSGQPLTGAEFQERLQTSLNFAVRSVNPAFRATEQASQTLDPFALGTPFWEQISQESAAAAASFRSSIDRLHAVSSKNIAIRASPTNTLTVRSTNQPPLLYGLAFAAGFALITGAFVGRRPRRERPPSRSAAAPISVSGPNDDVLVNADSATQISDDSVL